MYQQMAEVRHVHIRVTGSGEEKGILLYMYTASLCSYHRSVDRRRQSVPHGLGDVGIQGHVSLRLRQEERGKEEPGSSQTGTPANGRLST